MKNTNTISGLRFQKYDDNTVHVHDDTKAIKFILDASSFKEEIGGAFNQLKNKDGLVKIPGRDSISLCLCKENGRWNTFVMDNRSIKQEIEKFIKIL